MNMVAALCSLAKASRFRREVLQLLSWSLGADEVGEVRDAFLELDLSRKGIILVRDLQEQILQKQPGTTEVVGSANMDDLLTFSDFLGAMVKYNMGLHQAVITNTFRRFDKDNSGSISVENLEKVIGR